ncbi:MAG: hypothetical protein F6K28_31285, partial [Microcoleus sp. SIO2G3]|nr:hypothetical protein [Microcoleus sp. SIO2G3]
NIHLLHKFIPALADLRETLNRQFKFRGKLALPDPECWSVLRLDLCYAWRFADQRTAQHYLNSLKHLSYPKKKPIIYETSIMFPGGTFSLKFYLKEPEFKAHDRKELLKAKASLEWIEHLELISTGVLRCEATLRTKYLRRQEIATVSDLVRPSFHIEWDAHLEACDDFNPKMTVAAIMANHAQLQGSNLLDFVDSVTEASFKDGMKFEAPTGVLTFPCDEHAIHSYYHPGGGFTVRQDNKLENKLQQFITKFVGDNTQLQSADKVKLKLLEHYKPVKASRLVSFWLYVQKFGESDAKETFGRDSFYASKRDLKKAGVSLLDEEAISSGVDKDFLRDFELAVPSKHCTNQHDDFRESANVLNFIPMTSGNPCP